MLALLEPATLVRGLTMDTITIIAIWVAQNFGLAGIAIAYAGINILLVYVAARIADKQMEKDAMQIRLDKIRSGKL